MVKNPQFEGQTKGRLGNSEVQPAVESIISLRLAEFLEDLKNGELAQKIVEKAVKAAKVREAARKARDVARARITRWRPRRWWASCPPARAARP